MQKAQTADFKPFDASKWQIGIVLSEFNSSITAKLYENAIKRAKAYKLEDSNIKTIKVAGAIEVPLALQHLAKTGQYNALLCIGCVIRGATPHFDYVCQMVTQGTLQVQLDYGQAIGFGVLTCENEAQALERTNLGADHLDAALQLAKAISESD